MLAGLEAVVFDLDNTLCAYVLSVEQVLEEALRRAGIAVEALGDLREVAARYEELWDEVRTTVSSTRRLRLCLLERLLAERGCSEPGWVERLSEAYGAVRDETGVRPVDGAARLLKELHGRYRTALVTNGPSDIQWEKIRGLGIDWLFDAIVVAGELGIYKPDRRIFELLLDRLGVPAASTLFVGDSPEMDIAGARAVGMRTAWVRGDGAAPLGAVGADLEISDVTALREVLL